MSKLQKKDCTRVVFPGTAMGCVDRTQHCGRLKGCRRNAGATLAQ
jgi:hypothetical protein